MHTIHETHCYSKCTSANRMSTFHKIYKLYEREVVFGSSKLKFGFRFSTENEWLGKMYEHNIMLKIFWLAEWAILFRIQMNK